MSINLAILWHMHQPYYFDPLKNKFMLPWVRLHATKDYLDMLLILEKFPDVKITFNVVPSLLKQLREYERGITDIFLEHTLIPAEELTLEQRVFILGNFFLANWNTMVYPFPRYRELLEKRGRSYFDLTLVSKKFSSQELRDLQVLFNLAWVDPLHRNSDAFLKELQKKGSNFTEDEKRLLIEKHMEIIKQIIPTYKKMVEKGQIELSVSPFYHPILPLVYNNYKAKECMPHALLPEHNFKAPEDAEAQIKKAIAYFEEIFGFKPQGMWPSEGAVSEEIIRLIGEAGIKWIATDEEILAKSINSPLRSGDRVIAQDKLYAVYDFVISALPQEIASQLRLSALPQQNASQLRLSASPQEKASLFEGVKIFFRDRILSDLIGFVYSNWQADTAVKDFISRIKKAQDGSIVSVILDGENAWEYFENDGLNFLMKLYGSLQNDKDIRTVTFSEYLKEKPNVKSLSKLYPGSWINADFSIWIGHEEDNLSWEYLYKVRQDLVSFQKENPDKDLSDAWEEIYIAEGSDWNWWYGDEHHTETKDIFDEIYRNHLISVYFKIGKEPPAFLFVPITKIMREIRPETEPKGFIYPKIDGKVTGYFEWLEAGKFNLQKMGGSMHKSEGLISYLYFGFNRQSLFLRIDPYCTQDKFEGIKIQIQILEPKRVKIVCNNLKERLAEVFVQEDEKWFKKEEIDTVAFEHIFEIELPFNVIEVKQEEDILFFIEILKNSYFIERAPDTGFIKIHVPKPEFDKEMWF